jgi:hypothetical protein
MAEPSPVQQRQDWSDQLVDRIVQVVERVRSATTGPLLKVVRAVVYGIIVVGLGLMLVTLLIIALVRLLDQLPGGVWLPYLILGGLFTLTGLILWTQRSRAGT